MTDFTPTPEPRKPIHVIHLCGFREQWNNGPSDTFLHALDRDRFLPILVQYSIDYGQPTPFADSAAEARRRTIEQIMMAPGQVCLSGYSAGALVMGDLARDIAFGHVDGVMASDVAAVALLADPKRPEGAGAPGIPTPGGYGIAGERLIPDLPVFWGSASEDPIADLQADNPLRTVADLSPLWSTDPLKARAWAIDMSQKLIYRQLQPWWMHPFRPVQQFEEAIAALNAYAWQGKHSDDYIRQGVSVALAAAVNEAVQ